MGTFLKILWGSQLLAWFCFSQIIKFNPETFFFWLRLFKKITLNSFIIVIDIFCTVRERKFGITGIILHIFRLGFVYYTQQLSESIREIANTLSLR